MVDRVRARSRPDLRSATGLYRPAPLTARSGGSMTMTPEMRALMNQAAVSLVRFHWREEAGPSPYIRPALEWACRTMADGVAETSAVIHKVLERDELARAGYIQAAPIAEYVAQIADVEP